LTSIWEAASDEERKQFFLETDATRHCPQCKFHREQNKARNFEQDAAAPVKKPRTHKPPASQPVNEQLAEHPTLAAAPTNPTDKMSKIQAALADAGSDGLDVGQLYRKAGAYLTDLDIAVKQGLIRQTGERYFA